MDERQHPNHHGHAHGHHAHGHGHHAHDDAAGSFGDSAGLADLLDLDIEILDACFTDMTARIREASAEQPPGRLVDLGAGTGAGTLALLTRFPDADATAVDVDPEMLARLAEKAERRGMGARVRTVQADLDAAWPELGPADVVWASASLHHTADPLRALGEIARVLRPGGLFALLEMDGIPRFLPDDLGFGKPGLEDRCHEAMARNAADHVPHLGADWDSVLATAGYTVVDAHTYDIRLTGADLPESAGRYARGYLSRVRAGLADALSPDDLAALDRLVAADGPDSVLRRDDLVIRTTRELRLARPA
ncbi:MAG: methyltransferase domain-containing protein [Streptomycetaceae bacterium]|nr:methyltransferase domain-containing protein [Streptomycetaceae bacterium]